MKGVLLGDTIPIQKAESGHVPVKRYAEPAYVSAYAPVPPFLILYLFPTHRLTSSPS